MSFTDRIDQALERRRAFPKKADAEIAALRAENERLRAKLNALQSAQANMRDPERTMVCDIIANGMLRPWGYDALLEQKP